MNQSSAAKLIIIMNNYTVLLTVFTYGSEAVPCEKDNVRKQCERLKAITKISTGNVYQRIEVVNNENGEIREYWNNHENKIKF